MPFPFLLLCRSSFFFSFRRRLLSLEVRFPSSVGNEYILVAIDYMSKWVEAVATPINDAKAVVKFIKKNIFARFGMPRVLISDGGSHFCNAQLQKVLS